ncbi:MAG: hypothetical protein WA891_00695 [Acidobacteriaceae bacterium]|jgi:hypothetical protein
MTVNIVRAFLHGVTGAGLFRRLDYPGAPAEFVDSRPLDEIYASGEFDRTLHHFQAAVLEKQRNDAKRAAARTQEDTAKAVVHR